MKQILIILIAFTLLMLPCQAYSAVITAASASYAHVSAAVSSASAGDTVNVPAGTETWDTQLLITKSLYLIGAGVGNTVIKNGIVPADTMIYYYPLDYEIGDQPFRLSGFTFDANGDRVLSLGSGKSAPFTRQTKVRVDHNSFINTGAESGGAGIFN